jgi:DNA-binding protein YbaB
MTDRRTTEELLAAAEERLTLTEQLPGKLASVRGWANNGDENVRVTVDVHGAVKELKLAESALDLGPDALGEEIVRLAGDAQKAALRQGVDTLGQAMGDAAAIAMLRSTGLADLVDEDAEVLPYVPGTDPNAHTWNVIPPGS